MLRAIAGFVGLLFPIASAALALFISGVEPDRPVSLSFVSGLTGLGLLLSVGFLLFSFVPRHHFARNPALRFICVVTLAAPLFPALYFASIGKVPAALIALAFCGVAGACIFSLFNTRTDYA